MSKVLFFWQLKGYKPNKRYVKLLQKEVVSMGFLDSALLSIVTQENGLLLETKGNGINSHSFIAANAME